LADLEFLQTGVVKIPGYNFLLFMEEMYEKNGIGSCHLVDDSGNGVCGRRPAARARLGDDAKDNGGGF
jgi:hypothetical protein